MPRTPALVCGSVVHAFAHGAEAMATRLSWPSHLPTRGPPSVSAYARSFSLSRLSRSSPSVLRHDAHQRALRASFLQVHVTAAYPHAQRAPPHSTYARPA